MRLLAWSIHLHIHTSQSLICSPSFSLSIYGRKNAENLPEVIWGQMRMPCHTSRNVVNLREDWHSACQIVFSVYALSFNPSRCNAVSASALPCCSIQRRVGTQNCHRKLPGFTQTSLTQSEHVMGIPGHVLSFQSQATCKHLYTLCY